MSFQNIKSITCTNIPPAFLDKKLAKKHFGYFGSIKNFSLRPSRLLCTVEYDLPEQALRAKENAGMYKGHFFEIDFTIPDLKPPTPDPDIDPDVQSELQALRELSRGSNMAMSPPDSFVRGFPIVKKPQRDDILNEIEQLQRTQCITAEEKYRTLENRDKLIRLKCNREGSTQNGKYTIGTCTDMCPEKERYMRNFQNQVSIFEKMADSNQMDYNIAVKQYSRSSADQEAPLAHELRPEDVLQMSMQFLMCEIMDLDIDENVNISDWFHFLWDRMRGIRKDITQQNLCTVKVVELLEQCARFHIHCSARLVAEDPSVFDPKLNTENLTKCLQSLKYMYDDLRLKGVKCQHEAEFRGYIVLLNLNDGNFLWEFKHLPPEILKSKEIKFALQVHSSVSSNNYIGFFRLVAKTSYLNACILLRYFTQVRMKALKSISKAYSIKGTAQIRFSYLVNCLQFENDDAAINFLEYHGILIEELSGGYVVLDSAFDYPVVPYQIERAIKTIELKCDKAISEIVYGGENSTMKKQFEIHKLHESFDENGYITVKGLLSLVGYGTDEVDKCVFKVPTVDGASPKQNMKKIIKKATLSPVEKSSPVIDEWKISSPAPTPTIALDEPQKSKSASNSPFFMSPISNIISSTAKSIFNMTSVSAANTPSTLPQVNSRIVLPPITANIAPSIPVFVPPVKPQWFPAEEFVTTPKITNTTPSYHSTTATLNDRTSLTPYQMTMANNDVTPESSTKSRPFKENKIVAPEFFDTKYTEISDEILNELVLEEVETATKSVFDKIEYVSKKLPQIVYNEILEDVINEKLCNIAEPEILVENIIEARQTRNLYKVLQKWLNFTRKSINRRRQLDKAPIYLPKMSLSDAALEFKHPFLNYKYPAVNLRHVAENITFDSKKKIEEIKFSKIIDIKETFHKRFNFNKDLFWNGFISLPDTNEVDTRYCMHMEQWLYNTFPECNDECLVKLQITQKQSSAKLAICLQKTIGMLNNINNASGVIFIIHKPRLSAARKRLQKIISSLTTPNIPIAIIITHCDEDIGEDLSTFGTELCLDDTTNYTVFIQNASCSLKKCFESSLDFVSTYTEAFDFPLKIDDLKNFLVHGIGNELWYRLQKLNDKIEVVTELLSTPNETINFFNQALDHLRDVINHNFADYPEFPQTLKEFLGNTDKLPLSFKHFPPNWKSFPLEPIHELLESIKIPSFSNDSNMVDEGTLKIQLLKYVKMHLPSIPDPDKLVNGAMLYYSQESISWVNIFRLIITENCEIFWTQFYSDLPKAIVYHEREFADFIELRWFLRNLKSKESLRIKRSFTQHDELQNAAKKRRSDVLDIQEDVFNENINEVLRKAEVCSNSAEMYIKKSQDKINKASKINEALVKLRNTAQYLEDSNELWLEFENKLNEK